MLYYELVYLFRSFALHGLALRHGGHLLIYWIIFLW